MNPQGLLLSDDLIFSSKVTGTARAQGLVVKVHRTADSLLQAARATPPPSILLDLHYPGLDAPGLITQLAGCTPRPRLVGYGSHVDAAGLQAARQAGCDLVMPRSQFVKLLERDLASWLTPRDHADSEQTRPDQST